MAQPETSDRHVNVRFPADIHAAMVTIAAEENRPVGAWVRHEIMKVINARQTQPAQYGGTTENYRKNVAKITAGSLLERDVTPIPKGGKK